MIMSHSVFPSFILILARVLCTFVASPALSAFSVPSGSTVAPATITVDSPPQSPNSSQSADEAALRSLIERFYAACAKKDAPAALALWDDRSPAFIVQKSELETLVQSEQVDVSRVTIGEVRVNGDSASVRASANIFAFNSSTNTGQSTGGPTVFKCIRKDGQWRITDSVAAVADLIDRLEKATPEARRQVLSDEKPFIDKDVARGILGRATGAYFRADYDTAQREYAMAIELSEYIGLKESVANAYVGLGNVYKERSNYPLAIDYYRKALALFQELADQDSVASTLDNLGQTYYARRDYELALQAFQKALGQYSASNNQIGGESIIESIGGIYYDKGDYPSALEYFNRGLAISETLGDRTGSLRLLINIGNTQFAQKHYDLAVQSFERALPKVDPSSDNALAARAYSDAAQAYAAAHKLGPALQNYNRAIELLGGDQDKNALASALEGSGFVRRDLGDYAGALTDFNKCLTIYEAAGKRPLVAGLLNDIASVLYKKQDFDSAASYYQRALEVSEAIHDTGSTISEFQNLGNCAYEKPDFTSAEDYYRKSLIIAEDSGNKSAAGSAFAGIGLAESAMANYQGALESYFKALETEEALGDKSESARTLNNIGAAFALQADFGSALEYYSKALGIYDEIQDKAGCALTLDNIGLAQDSAGMFKEAIDALQKCLALENGLNDAEGKARALGNLGRVYYDQGNMAAALDFYQRSLQSWQATGKSDGIAGTLAALGNAYYGEKDYARALGSYQKSLTVRKSLGNKEAIAFLLSAIASVQYSSGDYAASSENAEKAASEAREIGNQEILWYALFKSGQGDYKSGRSDAAKQKLEEAISILRDINGLPSAPGRAPAFGEARKAPYAAMANLLAGNGQIDQGLAYCEREKQQILMNLLSKVRITRGMTPPEIESERAIINKVVSADAQYYTLRLKQGTNAAAQLQTESKAAHDRYRAFEDQLLTVHPDLKRDRGLADPANEISQTLRGLLPGSIVMEYVLTDDKVCLFTAFKQTETAKDPARTGGLDSGVGIKAYSLSIDPSILKDKIALFRQALVSADSQSEQQAKALYEDLIAPAAPDLVGKSSLIVIPDGELWSVPFQALQHSDGRYLIEDLSVVYVPSLAALRYSQQIQAGQEKSRRDSGPPSLLVISEPTISAKAPGQVRAAHPGAQAPAMETTTLISTYGPERTGSLTKNRARKDLLYKEAAKYDFLHLGAPGIIDDLNPPYSFVSLAPREESSDPGSLTARELINAELNSRIAIFSGTARRQELLKSGDGMIFLEWALLSAHCPAALIAQWQAPAETTGQLMADLHMQLAAAPSANESDFAGSLRQASLKMIGRKDHRSPYYWAGFSAMGAAVRRDAAVR